MPLIRVLHPILPDDAIIHKGVEGFEAEPPTRCVVHVDCHGIEAGFDEELQKVSNTRRFEDLELHNMSYMLAGWDDVPAGGTANSMRPKPATR